MGLNDDDLLFFKRNSLWDVRQGFRMISTGCEMESNGEHFWPAVESMFERIDVRITLDG